MDRAYASLSLGCGSGCGAGWLKCSGQATIFGEDLAMLESQQRNLDEQPNRHLMRLNIDMGGFESRRILERLVAEAGLARGRYGRSVGDGVDVNHQASPSPSPLPAAASQIATTISSSWCRSAVSVG